MYEINVTLSYAETLRKVVQYLNDTLTQVSVLTDALTSLQNEEIAELDSSILANANSINDITSKLLDIATLNDHTFSYTYYPNGDVQTVTEKDKNNNVIKTTTYNYSSTGDVTSSVTVMNGKTLTTTYNYDSSGTITSTVNVLS